jgi:hypothetical protein
MTDRYVCLIENEDNSIKLGATQLCASKLQRTKKDKIIFEKHVQDYSCLENHLIKELEKNSVRIGRKKVFTGDKNQIIKVTKNLINMQKEKIYPCINIDMFKVHYPYCAVYSETEYNFQNREYFQLGQTMFTSDPEIMTNQIIEFTNFDSFKTFKSGKLYFYNVTNFPMKSNEHFNEYCKKIKMFINFAKTKKLNQVGFLLKKAKIDIKL